MSSTINKGKLKKYANAFIMYELASHGVDPRETLEGTTFRVKGNVAEGYKYDVYDKYHKKLQNCNSYVDTIMEALPGINLASFHQKGAIEQIIEKDGPVDLENALRLLYLGNDDAKAFREITNIIGGRFDVLGFLFFLKNRDQYLPLRSRLFDERFKYLDIESNLEGSCTWEKYQDYNSWIKTIYEFLRDSVNPDITMLDAHSFVWILPGTAKYVNEQIQIVEHTKYGKGTVLGFENDLIVVQFGKDILKFGYENAINKGLLKYVPMDFDIYGEKKIELNKKGIDLAQALLELLANRKRQVTYSELSEMTDSKPNPHVEMNDLLDQINMICDVLDLPHISALVVNKETRLPGKGFKELCVSEFGYDSNLTTQQIVEKELDKIGKCDEWKKLADYLSIDMPEASEEDPLPEEVPDDTSEPIFEGAKKQIIVNAYERDPKAKKKCKDFYMKRDGRLTCQVCGFDFGTIYGAEYANMVHIHHKRPLYEIKETYVVDPINDLIPVCPNCHMVLHANGGTSVEALKKKIKTN